MTLRALLVIRCVTRMSFVALYSPAAMHDLDPVFRRWTRSPKVAALMAALGFARPLPVQVGALGGGCARGRAVGAMVFDAARPTSTQFTCPAPATSLCSPC